MSSVLGDSNVSEEVTCLNSPTPSARHDMTFAPSSSSRSRSQPPPAPPAPPAPAPPAPAFVYPPPSASGAHAAGGERRVNTSAVVGSVRGTMEYQQAWDVELWRAIQVSQLRQQLQEQKKKALEGLAQFVNARQKQALAKFEIKEQDLIRREKRLAEEEKQMEKRKWRLAEMEKDIRHVRTQLADARRRAEADAKVEVERAKEDSLHSLALQEKRLHAAEAQAKHAEERLRQAQRDYLTLSEEFNRFRTRELTAPPEKVSVVESRVRAEFMIEHKAMQDHLERQHHEREQQLVKHNRELEEENKRLTALATKRKEQLRRATDEVAQLRLSCEALEEKLRRLQQPTESKMSAKVKKPKESHMLQPLAFADAVAISSVTKEIERLRHERQVVVEGSAGALDEDSDVVRCLDEKINDMVKRLHSSGQPTPVIAI